MNYLSVCSGVEAVSQAWEPLGWTPVAFAEIEPFPCAVLASRFPNVPNLGDMSNIHYNRETKELTNGTVRLVCDIDLLVGGTPCQSFSVAGKRAGLEGASGLAHHYARLLGEIQPRWFVWENVPGALSSVTYGDQRDFNFLLQQFAVGGDAALGCRWDLCWRVLDTQYVRVEHWPRAIPQRRRRVFVVGRLAADEGSGCEVLLEPEGVRGHPAPRRVKGQGTSGDTAPCAGGADGAERGVNCLTPGDHQNARVYGADGGYPTMFSIHGETSGADGTAVCVRTANTGANGYGITEGAIAIDRRNQYGLYECQDSIKSTVSDGGSTVAIYFKGGQSADGGLGVDEGACQTMQSKMSALEPTVAVAIDQQGGKGMCGFSKEQMPTICSDSHGTPHAVAIGIGQQWRTTKGEDVMPTLDTRLAAQVDKQMERNGSYLCGPIQ